MRCIYWRCFHTGFRASIVDRHITARVSGLRTDLYVEVWFQTRRTLLSWATQARRLWRHHAPDDLMYV